MLLTGLVLAVGLLVAVQISENIRGSKSNGINSTETQTKLDPNKTVDPVIFRAISEANGKFSITGTGPKNSVLALENSGVKIAEIRSDKDGVWRAEINVDPEQHLQLEAVLIDKQTVKIRSDEMVFRIPHETSDMAHAEPALIMITAPGGPSNIVQSPFRGLPHSGSLGLGPVDYDESGGVIFSGVSERAGRVRIYANDIVIGERKVEPNGRWYFIAAETLPRGAYDIRIELMESENVESQINLPFKRLSAQNNGEGEDENLMVEYDAYRWQVRRKLYGGGFQYTAIFAPEIEANGDED